MKRHSAPGYRVEVVPTAAHWESYWIPRAGIALARGFYRQTDIVDNPLFYSGGSTRGTTARGFERQAVDYVLLPGTRLDPIGAPARRSYCGRESQG